MPKALLDVAQQIQDDVEQSFASANSFFTLNDYAIRARDERDSELEREFLIQYQQSKTNFPIISPFWLKNITLRVEHEKDSNIAYADICDPLYEFPFDSIGVSVQDVAPTKFGCGQFIRISFNQAWAICLTATTEMVFFSLQGCRITLHNFNGCTDSLQVTIVPSQSALPLEHQTIPDGKAAQIIEVVKNRIFRDINMKLGKISTHINGNPNPMPNETGEIYQNLKTR